MFELVPSKGNASSMYIRKTRSYATGATYSLRSQHETPQNNGYIGIDAEYMTTNIMLNQFQIRKDKCEKAYGPPVQMGPPLLGSRGRGNS